MAQAALIENISDTARWVAVFRARESARPDALFQDPLAGRLAGLRGEQIADSLHYVRRHGWAMVTRTHLMDGLIRQQVEHGVEMVVNLAAGLDTRPYRMALPEQLEWVEVDLPEILTYKEVMLAGEQTKCRLERIKLDLADGAARRALFRRLGSQSAKTLVISEGLLVYLTPEQVGALATDLAGVRAFQNWIIDLASPALLRMLQKKVGKELAKGNSVMKFAPEKGPAIDADDESAELGKGPPAETPDSLLREKLATPRPDRIYWLLTAMERGLHAEEICELTKIDPWFIHQIEELTAMNRRAAGVTVETASKDLLREVKRHGASDEQLAQIWRTTPASVRL